MDEAEGNELGETTGFFLNFTKDVEVARDMARLFDVAVHERRGGS